MVRRLRIHHVVAVKPYNVKAIADQQPVNPSVLVCTDRELPSRMGIELFVQVLKAIWPGGIGPVDLVASD